MNITQNTHLFATPIKRMLSGLILATMVFVILPTTPAVAARTDGFGAISVLAIADGAQSQTLKQAFEGFVIPAADYLPLPAYASRTYHVDMTAYTSSIEECDSDPFITADGSHTQDGMIATNFLPFGTRVRIPTLFGDKVFTVHDRMNKRYNRRIDVWMEKKDDMREFGVKRNTLIEVIEWGDNATQWKKV